ncbi:T7SS effector LXG polymorphic toxin [Enterococcus sp. AZ170]
MVIGEVQTQTEQIKSYAKTYSQALESVSTATQGIQLAVGMSGEGMDAIKSYLSSVYPALCKAAILHSEAVVQANEQYVEAYISQCGSEDLDSEELQEQINEADKLIQGFQSSKDSYTQAKQNLSDDKDKLMGMIFQAAITIMDAGITRNQAKKSKIEEKLQKFLAFCDQSTSYFDGLSDTGNLLSKGMQALGVNGNGSIGPRSWNGKGFSLKDTSWINDVNKNWNDRIERRDKKLLDGCKIIHVFDEKYGKDVYMFEKDGYHYTLNEDDLSADLKKLIKKYGLDVLELSPTEMSKRVNDFQKSGRDYFSGDKVGIPGFGALAHGQDFMGKAQESGLWDAMWALGLTGAAVRNAQIYGNKISGPKLNNKNTNDFATEVFLPDEYYKNNYSPMEGIPNSRMEFNRLGSSGSIEKSIVIYDSQGKQSMRIDFSDHGNSLHHTNPHIHEYNWFDRGRAANETKYFLDENGLFMSGTINKDTNTIQFLD